MSSVSTNGAAPVTSGQERPGSPWYNKLVGLLLAILCFEMGMFLIAFPWSQYWSLNYFSWVSPEWRQVWMSPYFRGGVSGLGLLNLFLSLVEVLRIQTSVSRRPES